MRERSARTGRNPQTGEEIQIAAGKVPAFKAGKELKKLSNKQETSHFIGWFLVYLSNSFIFSA